MFGVINKMIRVVPILLAFYATFVHSNEADDWFAGPVGKDIKDERALTFRDKGFSFRNKNYNSFNDIKLVCDLKTKGTIRLEGFENISIKRSKKYSDELKKCGWKVIFYEEIDDSIDF